MAPTLLTTCFADSAEGARGSYLERSQHLGLYFLLSQRHTLKAGSSASAGKSGATQQLPKSLHWACPVLWQGEDGGGSTLDQALLSSSKPLIVDGEQTQTPTSSF